MTPHPWLAQLNGPRQRAVSELEEWGTLSAELRDAIRDEKYDHAKHVILTSEWAKSHRFTAARLAHQLASGEQQ